jgi:NADH:ubiquinone oxidoreductase subunit 6 (subunit J)
MILSKRHTYAAFFLFFSGFFTSYALFRLLRGPGIGVTAIMALVAAFMLARHGVRGLSAVPEEQR